MTKTAALHAYFNGFMTAYPTDSVPEETIFPWLTYEVVTGAWSDSPVGITVNLWFRTDSEAVPNKAAEDLRKYITENDMIECDDGYIWVKPGSPWAQSLKDEADAFIKRRYINITLEYLTR